VTAVRVVVVDDHPVFRLGMVALLGSLAGIDVVGEAASVAAARALLGLDGDRGVDVDVVLADLDLGDGSGVDLTRDLSRSRPDVRVLVVSMHETDDAVVAAVRAGARGYLVKSASPEEVERAVLAVAGGAMILSPTVAERAMAYVVGGRASARVPLQQLTDREREVLDLVAAGLSNAQIADRLCVTEHTVKSHLGSLFTKLGVHSRSEAIAAHVQGPGRFGPSPERAESVHVNGDTT
jgi:DNA-binding NarL/FixJ family response regulator